MTTPPTPNYAPTDATPSYVGAAPAAPVYAPQAPVASRPALPTTMGQSNAFALVSVILAFIQPLAGIVFGHIALSQIKKNGDAGRGMALTGLIVGYVYFAMLVLFVILYVSMVALVVGTMGAAFSELGNIPNYNSY